MVRAELYPPIEPFRQDYLKRDDGHKIYYELCGNPKGYPMVFVHGGPGAGCSPDCRRFFEPERWLVVLIDQDGSGRSEPAGCLRNNTTWDLVKDMHCILNDLGIKRAAFFGGSWGTTLIMDFNIVFPGMVSGRILRGVWLGEKAEIDYYLNGGIKRFFPHVWERFSEQVPPEHRQNPAPFYYEKLLHGPPEEQSHFAYEWAWMEEKLLFLQERSDEEIAKALAGENFVPWATIEAHYCMEHLFMPEGYIMNNVHRLPEVPTSIVHGQYDVLCFPESAYRLHKVLPGSKLIYPMAGHYATCPENQKALIQETELLYDQIAR